MLGRRLVFLTATLLTAAVLLPAAVAALAPQVASAAAIKATDYSQRSHWLALPSSISKRVDVFYLYPSAYTKTLASQPNVCPVNDPGMMQGAQVAFSRQATAFTPCANIFAPYYRQADAKWSLACPRPSTTASSRASRRTTLWPPSTTTSSTTTTDAPSSWRRTRRART